MSEITESNSSRIENLSMVEVYQLAADIGKDLESLIEQFGGEDFRNLMPKVIRCLEYLEGSVKKVETQVGSVRNLEGRLAKSKQEFDLKTKENVRLVQELEEANEKKSEDDTFWVKQLTELQKENAFLKDQVSEKDVIAVKERVQEQEAVKVLVVMKQTVDKQRNHLRTLEAEIRQKTGDIDALQEQIERLVKLNHDLHQKNELIQAHAKGLIREKSHLMTQMRAMEKDRPLQHGTTVNYPSSTDTTQTQEDASPTNGMILIDPNDPNRPRFTVEELYHVLRERDELKFKLFLIEEDTKSQEEADEEKTSTSPHKSESTISKFFKSLFKSPKKRSHSPVRESDSGSSEGNWEVLNREDSLPTVGYVVGDVKDPEKELIRILKKYQQQSPPRAESLRMEELTSSAGEPAPGSGVGEGAGSQGHSEDLKTVKVALTSEGTLSEEAGRSVNRRDENYNVNNNRGNGQGDNSNGRGDSPIEGRGNEHGVTGADDRSGMDVKDGENVESCNRSDGEAVGLHGARGDSPGEVIGGARAGESEAGGGDGVASSDAGTGSKQPHQHHTGNDDELGKSSEEVEL